MLGRNMARDILRDIRRQQSLPLPGQELRGVAGADRVGGVNADGIFLRHAA